MTGYVSMAANLELAVVRYIMRGVVALPQASSVGANGDDGDATTED